MEDYLSAFKERALDTHSLLKSKRTTGCAHIGGITIECLLKAIVVKQNRVTHWKSNRHPQALANPKHNLIQAINLVPALRRRLNAAPGMEDKIKTIQRPINEYIAMRYEGGSMPVTSYNDWCVAYKEVLKWLHSQKMH